MAVSTSIAEVHAGPAWVLFGDPTQSMGAGLVELGEVPSVTTQLTFRRQMAKNEIGQILQDGVYGEFTGATVSISMMKTSAEILAAMVTGFTDETSSISAETAMATLTGSTIVIVPDDVKDGSALTDLKTQYIPSAFTSEMGAFVHNLMQDGGDDSNPYTITFESALAATDQAGQAINTDYRVWFRGDPADAINEGTPTAWSLPSGY